MGKSNKRQDSEKNASTTDNVKDSRKKKNSKDRTASTTIPSAGVHHSKKKEVQQGNQFGEEAA